MDALKSAIRREQNGSNPRTLDQLVYRSLCNGVYYGAIFGLLSGGATAMIDGCSGIVSRGFAGLRGRFGEMLRVSVISGTVSGVSLGAPIALLYFKFNRKRLPIEESKVVRNSACIAAARGEIDVKDDSETSKIARKALETVTPERLIQDLHLANRTIHRARSWGVIGLGVAVGVPMGYTFFSWRLGYQLAHGLSPIGALKRGALVGGGAGFGMIICGLYFSQFTQETIESGSGVRRALKRLGLRQLSQKELLQAIETVYAKVPEKEKQFEALVRQQLNLVNPDHV